MDTNKIIVFNAYEPSIVCPLSYFWNQGYHPYSAPLVDIEVLWDNPDVWLLGVSPGISTKKTDFDIFLDFHQDKIISLQNLVDFKEDRDLNPEAKTLLSGWRQQTRLRALAREIRDQNTWSYSKIAARYGKALTASRTLNNHKNHENLMLGAAREIQNKKNNFEITKLAEQHQQIVETTEKILKKIRIKDSDFSIPNREVAYGYLDNLSPLADLYDIKQEALKRFPYLVVIQFRHYGQEFTWLGSRSLNIRQLLLINEASNNQEVLIKRPFKKINKEFREIISEIT